MRCGQVCGLWRAVTEYEDCYLWKKFSHLLLREIHSSFTRLRVNSPGKRHRSKVIANMYLWCQYCAYPSGGIGCDLLDTDCCPSCWVSESKYGEIQKKSEMDRPGPHHIMFVHIFSIMGRIFHKHIRAMDPARASRDATSGWIVLSQEQYQTQYRELFFSWEENRPICDCCDCVMGCGRTRRSAVDQDDAIDDRQQSEL